MLLPFSNGKGVDLAIDDHRSGVAGILYTNLDMGEKRGIYPMGMGDDVLIDVEHWPSLGHHTFLSHIVLLLPGKATRPYITSGGAANEGLHAGPFTTLWNIRASKPVGYPSAATFPDPHYPGMPWGFYLNFVGEFIPTLRILPS